MDNLAGLVEKVKGWAMVDVMDYGHCHSVDMFEYSSDMDSEEAMGTDNMNRAQVVLYMAGLSFNTANKMMVLTMIEK
jgi:hypothetical protein